MANQEVKQNNSQSVANMNKQELSSASLPKAEEKVKNSSSKLDLTKIQFPDSVKEIGKTAFTSQESLKNIEMPGSVKEIGKTAFTSQESLKNIETPGSIGAVGKEALQDFSSLENVKMPSSVKEVSKEIFKEGIPDFRDAFEFEPGDLLGSDSENLLKLMSLEKSNKTHNDKELKEAVKKLLKARENKGE